MIIGVRLTPNCGTWIKGFRRWINNLGKSVLVCYGFLSIETRVSPISITSNPKRLKKPMFPSPVQRVIVLELSRPIMASISVVAWPCLLCSGFTKMPCRRISFVDSERMASPRVWSMLSSLSW